MPKMYIVVLDEFPDYMTPTLVAHTVLGAHLKFKDNSVYKLWLEHDFRKCVLRVNQKEFDKTLKLPDIYVGREYHTLEGRDSCIVVCPQPDAEPVPNVLKWGKLWSPKCQY